MSSAVALGSFQFKNLVNLRIPFIVSHPSLDFSKFFSGEELRHLQMHSENFISADEILIVMKTKGYPLHWPIVWICEDGVKSKSIADSGESIGLINCNYLDSGINGFTG